LSKPRYIWWGYVKNMIRRYPALKKQYEELHIAATTADYSGMAHSGQAGRNTERVAIRELTPTEQREYDAVSRAIATTERYKDGVHRLLVIDVVFWQRSHTLEGAAMMVPCHYKTAQGWHNEFIRLVASYCGLMDS